MDFSKIQELNAQLKYTNIKGKNYIQVNQRVLAFRELYPNGRISTEIVKLSQDGPNSTVVVKASVYDGEAIISTGHAFENTAKNKNINTFSALENCETSAVGRALGFLGIGATDSIASLDEMRDAGAVESEPIESPNNYAQQLANESKPAPAPQTITPAPVPQTITPEHKEIIEKLYKGENLQRLLDHYQIATIEQLEDRIAAALIAQIAARQKEKKGKK